MSYSFLWSDHAISKFLYLFLHQSGWSNRLVTDHLFLYSYVYTLFFFQLQLVLILVLMMLFNMILVISFHISGKQDIGWKFPTVFPLLGSFCHPRRYLDVTTHYSVHPSHNSPVQSCKILKPKALNIIAAWRFPVSHFPSLNSYHPIGYSQILLLIFTTVLFEYP